MVYCWIYNRNHVKAQFTARHKIKFSTILDYIPFANNLDPCQDRQSVDPDLNPNCIKLWLCSRKILLKKLHVFWKKSADDKKHENFPECNIKMLPSKVWVFYFGILCIPWPRNCMLCNCSCFCCPLLTFFKINFFKKFFQQNYQSGKQLGFRSGPTFCRSWSGSKLFAKVISRRQKLQLAMKEL